MPPLLSALFLLTTAAPPIPQRIPLGTLPIIPGKPVDRVETNRVAFAPGQEMPRHKHNVPVVCFVTKGSFAVSIGDAPVRSVHAGDVTLEPAGAIVNYFRNASSKAPGELLCAALAGKDDRELNVMLAPPRNPIAP
ncbi:MAG: cupin domain-containing protein [Alphaproteobacteria bacterium]|nr:cupin domain-containing protein [Alphaproteobacteria bacterium]